MRIWIAQDWFGTLVYTTPPKLVNNGSGNQKEWYGYREQYLEQFIPKEIKKSIKMNKCIECELTVTIKPNKCADCNNIKGCITCTDGDQYAHITKV